MDFETISAFCCMPLLMVIAAQGWAWMTCVFICFPFFFALYQYKLPSKMRTRFFVAWSIVSFFFLLAVFELEVVPYLEILFIENFILMFFVSSMCLCIYFAKSRVQEAYLLAHSSEKASNKTEQTKRTRCEFCSVVQPPRTYHCDVCGYCVYQQDHHNVWLDICIGAPNKKYFMGAILTLLCSCLYSSNLTLTTICHPTLVGNLLLMPEDCSDVFGDIHIAICFVSAVYTLIVAVFAIYLLFQQMWLIAHNATYQEWKQGLLGLHSNGIFRNWIDFCRGYSKVS